MYGSEQSGMRSREELRGALARLEEAVARHEVRLAAAPGEADDPAAQVLRRSVAMMRQEADRLRRLVAAD